MNIIVEYSFCNFVASVNIVSVSFLCGNVNFDWSVFFTDIQLYAG